MGLDRLPYSHLNYWLQKVGLFSAFKVNSELSNFPKLELSVFIKVPSEANKCIANRIKRKRF